MAGIGGIGPTYSPGSLRRADKDGSGGGGGGRYLPGRRQQSKEHPDEDTADLSDQAKERLSHVQMMEPAPGNAEDSNAKLHILAEISQFNDHHARSNSRLKAILKPALTGSKLCIEDPEQGVTVQPFGDANVFLLSPQAVRAKLLTFDRSSGSLFDGRV